MAIQATCGSCFMEYSVKESLAGKKVKCKACGELFRVPTAQETAEEIVEFAETVAPPPRSRNRSSASEKKKSPGRAGGRSIGTWIVTIVGGTVGFLVAMSLILPLLNPVRQNLQPPVGFQQGFGEPANAPFPSGPPGMGAPGMMPQAAGPPSGDPKTLFPIASVPIPKFPELVGGRELPGTAVQVYELSLASANPGESGPGTRMNLRVYLPRGQASPGTLGCVLVAPAGTNLIVGNDLDDPNYHNETLPYAQAGYVTIMFSLDGGVRDVSQISNGELAAAYRSFAAAQAGLVNARNALEFALSRLPQVDPRRIFIAGHSSAAVLALLFAEHEPRLKGSLAYAPASDVEQRLADVTRDPRVELVLPGIGAFIRRSSPRTHMGEMRCPVYLFHAADDSNEPIATSIRFAADLQRLGKTVIFEQVPRGDHYESMIQEGIPRGILWIQSLPGE